MTQKEKALKKTIDRFTNLLNGQVSHGHTVYQIITFYEKCIKDETYKDTLETYLKEDKLMQNFIEADIDSQIEDYYDELFDSCNFPDKEEDG